MSNLEKWKAAKAAFNATESEYDAAHKAVCEAGRKRRSAWDALVEAAHKLSPSERKEAADYEYGKALSRPDRA